MPTFADREEHVMASVENVLKAIGDELGPAAERVLQRRIDQARFFVGGIHEPLNGMKNSGKRAIEQLDRLLDVLVHPEHAASWRSLLGLDYNPDAPKEHWIRSRH